MPAEVPVSIGIPVRNGQARIPSAIRSVLAQDFTDFEIIISDNGSTDATEDVCRQFAQSDVRISYFRQAENIGMLNNFKAVMHLARGRLFSWLGDDDTFEPSYVSRCREVLDADNRLLLVTPQIRVLGMDGSSQATRYEGTAFQSADAADRLCEMLRLLNEDNVMIDPMSALMRRERVVSIRRKNMLREDQIFACNLALAGRWAYIPEVLSNCVYDDVTRPILARRFGLPVWHSKVASARQFAELLRLVRDAPLDTSQKRRARAAVVRWYVGWHRVRVVKRFGRVVARSRPA